MGKTYFTQKAISESSNGVFYTHFACSTIQCVLHEAMEYSRSILYRFESISIFSIYPIKCLSTHKNALLFGVYIMYI